MVKREVFDIFAFAECIPFTFHNAKFPSLEHMAVIGTVVC